MSFRSDSRRSRAGLVLALAAVLLAVVVGVWAWTTRPDFAERVTEELPPLPTNLARQPTVAPRIEAADQRVRQGGADLPDAVAELGRLYHANGYFEEAAVCWALLQIEQPKVARWSYYLADTLRALNDPAGTQDAFAEAAERAPDYAPVWLQRAGLAFKQGEWEQAEAFYRRRLALQPGDPYARLGLIRVALQGGRQAEARDAVESLVRDAPDFSPAHNLYAEMLAGEGREAEATQHRYLGREAGRFKDAEDPWLDELQAWCFDPERLHLYSTVLYQTGRRDEARAVLQRAIALDPADPRGYILLGELALKMGDAEAALQQAEVGLQHATIADERAHLHFLAVEAWRMRNEPVRALERVDAALAAHPQAFALLSTRGSLLLDLQRFPEAEAALRLALKREPNDAETRHALGLSLLGQRKPETAVAEFKAALTTRPTFAKSLLMLGQLALEAGDLEAAAQALRPVYTAHPGQVVARRLLAQYHLRSGLAARERGANADVERHLRDGLSIDPDHPALTVELGLFLLEQGRLEEARPVLEKYRQLQPEDEQGAMFLGQLYLRTGRLLEARTVLQEAEQLARKAGNDSLAAFCREMLGRLPSR